MDDLGPRVQRLEDDAKELKVDVKAIRLDLAEVKGKLSNMPSAASFGELKGRVDSLPTTGKLATLLGIAVAVMTVVTKWSEITALFGGGTPTP